MEGFCFWEEKKKKKLSSLVVAKNKENYLKFQHNIYRYVHYVYIYIYLSVPIHICYIQFIYFKKMVS